MRRPISLFRMLCRIETGFPHTYLSRPPVLSTWHRTSPLPSPLLDSRTLSVPTLSRPPCPHHTEVMVFSRPIVNGAHTLAKHRLLVASGHCGDAANTLIISGVRYMGSTTSTFWLEGFLYVSSSGVSQGRTLLVRDTSPSYL